MSKIKWTYTGESGNAGSKEYEIGGTVGDLIKELTQAQQKIKELEDR